MGSLGFRPPQFSEDLAWLPSWLHHEAELSVNHIPEPLTGSSQAFKDLTFLQGNTTGNGNDVVILSGEEGRYNSCHLYLSGHDDSQYSIADPSTSQGNVLRLCLHLSSDGASQDSQSPFLYASQARHGSKEVLPLQQVEPSAGPGEKSNQLKIDHNGFGVKFLPLTVIPIAVENVVPQSPTNKKDRRSQYNEELDYNAGGVHVSPLSSVPATVENVGPLSRCNYKHSEQKYEENCNSIHVKDADINDAVELSIAASEALVIHELMKTGSASEVLPTQCILEAALQVKQVRLEALKDDTGCPSDEIDEIDFLSDLDDSIMMDAFQDVGLYFSGFDDQHVCGSDISQVEETPTLENHFVDNGSKPVQLWAQQDKVLDDSALGLNSSSVPQPAEKISNISSVVQPQVGINSSAACISENAGADKMHYSIPDRFRSRWLGGWTAKEADASTKQQNNTKSIPKCFVGETSFLSESADVAPDENSFVQKNQMRSNIVSQSSILFEGLCDKTDEGIFISQEVRSSNLSLVDPLCSIVPCSISLENTGPLLAQNQNNGEVDTENWFSPKSEHGMEKFQRTSDLNVECVHVDSQAMPTTGECSEAPARRQLASLKTYSTLLPKNDAIMERRHYHDQQFLSRCGEDLLSLYQDVHLGCIRSPDKRNSEGSLLFSAVLKSIVGIDNKENQDSTIIRNPVAERSNHNRSHDQPAKYGAEVQIQSSLQRRSPIILNRMTRCHLQASENVVNNLAEEKNPKQAMAQETTVKFHQRKHLQKIQSRSKKPHNTQNVVRKRVCFSEVEVEMQQNRDPQRQQDSYQTSHRNSSIFKANKRSKFSNPRSISRTEDVKNCFTADTKDVKTLLFHGTEFLLTGFSTKKERVIVGLIQKYGGVVLLDIPSPPSSSRAKRISRSNFPKLPIVISSKKLQTIKFLYGCAVNALILKAKWLTDSIAEGSVVPPEKYLILSNQTDPKCTRIEKLVCQDDHKSIFDRVGIMLHGKHSFCTKLAAIIKHGGGQVFKTLQRLFQSLEAANISVGAIVAEDESRALRHLKFCASERKISMVPACWIAKSLHLGKLLPLKEKEDTPLAFKVPEFAPSVDWSEEI